MKAKDFRQTAWKKIGEQNKWGTIILIYLIYALIIGALAFTAIGSILVAGPLALGLAVCLLGISRKEDVRLERLFSCFNNFVPALLLNILMYVFIFLWSLLLVIPGLIKSYSYAMSNFILADNPTMSANDAITASRKMMDGNKWRLFCLDFSFIGWYLLCGLTFGLLTFFVEPYHQAARAEFYESIRGEKRELIGE